MKSILVLLVGLLVISGCGKGINEPQTVVHTDTVTLPTATVDEVARVVAEENEYRAAAGQAPLTLGLTCALHNLQATTPNNIPANPSAAVATFTYVGGFNQPNSSANDGLNILPIALKNQYKQWYLIKCQGQFVAINSRYYQFNLTSDDGSKLYLDGALLIDNDGNHGAQLRTGVKLLKRGIHTFRLDYMQGPAGNQALILEDETGVLPGALFRR